jgi:hypothetical protein
MSRQWTLPILILSLCSGGPLQANPLDSPGVVYIDGQPCNRACQSYMDWSYRALSARRHAERETSVVVPAELETERVEPVARPRAARHVAPVVRTAPHPGKAASNGKAAAGSKATSGRKIAVRNSAPQAPAKEIPAVAVKPEVKPEVAAEVKPEVALPPPATLEIAARPEAPAPGMASSKAGEIRKAESASPDDQDNLVALVLVRPEITSLSDLNNKNIAITEKQSGSSGRVSAALMAGGAAEVQFKEVEASAIERLISGEFPAAVLLASREVADLFPELEGFRTFRVPLKARL